MLVLLVLSSGVIKGQTPPAVIDDGTGNLIFNMPDYSDSANPNKGFNCTEDILILNSSTGIPVELPPAGSTNCPSNDISTFTPGNYYTYNGCVIGSECALAYKNQTGESVPPLGGCTPCWCRDAGGNLVQGIDCELLPDLVISAWSAFNTFGSGCAPVNFIEDIMQLRMTTTVANIGLGPFEVTRTGEHFCGTTLIETLADCAGTPDETLFTNCGEERREGLNQIIYETNSATGMMEEIPFTGNNGQNMYVAYHPSHAHLHIDDFLELTLREKVAGNNDPTTWPIVGDGQKISYCMVDSKGCVCQEPYACNDIEDPVALLENFDEDGTLDGNGDLWTNPNNSFWQPSNQALHDDYFKNTFADFPNHLLGKYYATVGNDCAINQCIQGLSPGAMDIYANCVPGNSLEVECGLNGTYYLVLEVNPKGIYKEENYDNNVAVVPVQVTTPTSLPFSNEIITGADLSSYTIGASATAPVWSDDNRINGTVVVPDGYTLTIEHCTIEFMTPESGIIVEKGGVLHVHGATLKGNDCLGNVWKGITIEGDACAALPTTPQSDINHGVVVTDHAIIQDAKIGIQVGSLDNGSDPCIGDFGGGFLETHDTEFINNSVGILYAPQLNISTISHLDLNNQFIINDVYKGDQHEFPTIGYVGVMTRNRRVNIIDNVFINNVYNPSILSKVDRGTAIISYGLGTFVLNNTFTNFYKGIDTYGQGSLLSDVIVSNSQFTSISKGITLNGNALSEIRNNDFTALLSGDYAVFGFLTRGIEVAYNTISINDIGTARFGIAVRNSGKEGGCIHNNTFIAPTNDACPPGDVSCLYRFRAAIQAEGGNNPNLTVDCNEFKTVSDFDLRVVDANDFKEQGGCVITNNLINPTANEWHSASIDPSSYHIYYQHSDPSQTIDVTYQGVAGSINEPTLITSNIDKFSCSTDVNDCTVCNYEADGLQAKIDYLKNNMDAATVQADYERFYSELMRTYLQNNMYEEAKTETAARGDVTGDKIMVATYVDERDLTAADQKLQSIPQDSQENIDFYDFYTAYISELINDTDPSNGKMETAAAATITNLASNSNNYFAQSSYAAIMDIDYQRTPAEESKLENDGALLNAPVEALIISPNPANNSIAIHNNNGQAQQLYIYSTDGKLQLSQPVHTTTTFIDINSLDNGIYICTLYNSSTHSSTTTKLIVLK